jgi:hypothetical protein
MKILAFCANCQQDLPHEVGISALNPNEVTLTCTCERVFKLPKVPATEFSWLLDAHKQANQGQVTMVKLEASNQAFLEDLKGLAL